MNELRTTGRHILSFRKQVPIVIEASSVDCEPLKAGEVLIEDDTALGVLDYAFQILREIQIQTISEAVTQVVSLPGILWHMNRMRKK